MQDAWSVVGVRGLGERTQDSRTAATMSYTEAAFSLSLDIPEKCFAYSTKTILEVKVNDKCLCTDPSSTPFSHQKSRRPHHVGSHLLELKFRVCKGQRIRL